MHKEQVTPAAHLVSLNVRHDLAPEKVLAQIEAKVASYEQDRIRFKAEAQRTLDSYEQAKIDGNQGRWSHPPEGPSYVDPMIDDWIHRERTHYALVRVIEMPLDGKRFRLVYGDVDDSTVTEGTGPFDSVDVAANWFFSSGR